MVKVKVVASFFQILIAGLRLETISSVPILGVADLRLDHIGNRMFKRTIDIVGAVVGLVGSLPIFVVIGGMIFYESPHRLIKSLEQFIEYFGAERKASVSREITKMFEETTRGSLLEILNYYKDKKIKGEIVIVLEGNKNTN